MVQKRQKSGGMSCQNYYKIIQQYKKKAKKTFDNWTFLDNNGNEVKGEQIKDARDGCEIYRILGLDKISCHCPEYNITVKILDKNSSQPLRNVYYEIENENKIKTIGITEDDGLTRKVESKQMGIVKVKIYKEIQINPKSGKVSILAPPIKVIDVDLAPKLQDKIFETRIDIVREIVFAHKIVDVLSEKTKQILRTAMMNSGIYKITITSTKRTLREQATIMYNNCILNGIKEQIKTYKGNSKRVIDIYIKKNAAGKNEKEIIDAMENEIIEIKKTAPMAFAHTIDFSVCNTLDIGLRGIFPGAFKKTLRAKLKNDSSVRKVLDENGCYHIEVNQ